MLNESLIKEDFEEFCKKHDLQYPYIEIQQYDIRENFYKLHEDMWDDMQEEFEDIETAIPVLDKNTCERRLNILIFRNNFNSLPTFPEYESEACFEH